jgi:hypothetical protein
MQKDVTEDDMENLFKRMAKMEAHMLRMENNFGNFQ